MRKLGVLCFFTALVTGCGSGSSPHRSSQARFDGTFGDAWETLATVPPAISCPGFTDYTPSGETGLFALQGTAIARFTPSGGWTPLPPPPIDFSCWPGPAWVGSSLYVMRSNAVYAFDIVGGVWTAPVASGVADTNSAQMTHDDAGHVYAVESDAPYRMVRFTVASGVVDYLDTGAFAGASVSEPRLAWDSLTQKLYVAPDYSGPRLFAFDPAAPGATQELASVPAAGGGIGTGIGDIFCGDRSGHLYAQGDTGCGGTNTMFQYDIASDTWIRLPDLPGDHGCNGAGTVSDDGWLYVAPGDTPELYRIRLN